MGVQVFYFPYGAGISSSSLKKRIYNNYEKMKNKADNHLPADVDVKAK
jgi:choline-phosphate cytidylyltransferase/glycerol-3-phosphate cytidylyltransferase